MFFEPGITNRIEFNVSLFKAGVGDSGINTARSGFPSVLTLKDGVKFGEHPLVVRCMKGIFELKPALPKYTEIWDVNIVLKYLRTFEFVSSLSFKELTLNLTMLRYTLPHNWAERTDHTQDGCQLHSRNGGQTHNNYM